MKHATKNHVRKKTNVCLCEKTKLQISCKVTLCFCFKYSTISVLLQSKIPRIYPSSMAVQASVCQTLSETLKTAFPCGGSNLKEKSSCLTCIRLSGLCSTVLTAYTWEWFSSGRFGALNLLGREHLMTTSSTS